jgi:DNA-binding transcriptional MerR regulator
MKAQLEGIRHIKLTGVAELAEHAARILAESGPLQERGTVSELPDERTVRYYLAEGLISPAEEKQGTASVFGYLHLLQLLVVKKLQAEHLPIRKIRELVGGRSERELERLLGDDRAATRSSARNEATSYLEKLLISSSQAGAASSPPAQMRAATPSQPAASPQVGHSSLLPGRTVGPIPPGESGTWERVEIEPGLELHIRGDYRPAKDTRGLRRLARLVLRIIESYSKRK